jgi:hypothetical protein
MAPSVPFVVETEYFLEEDDYFTIGVLGSITALGGWRVSKTVLAVQDPSRKGRWVLEVQLPCNTTFQWKWVVCNRQRTHIYR